MEYKAVAFDPGTDRASPSQTIASQLEKLIKNEAKDDWEFIGLQNHATVVPGSNGCFGWGASSPYEQTFSTAVFRK